MARFPKCRSSVTLVWLLSAFIFYAFYLMALRNSSVDRPSPSADAAISNKERRSRLYDKMERDLDENGAVFLKHGETSQSLSLSDIFSVKDGAVAPVLRAANPPVRANVLYLNPEYSVPISKAVKHIFYPYFDKGKLSFGLPFNKIAILLRNMNKRVDLLVFFRIGENSSLYHFSMFHASHHIASVPATENEVEAEATAVKAAVEVLSPLKIVLDRVVLTSTGVLLGCWQVVSGTDPVTIRAKLKSALPRAPEKQLYDAAILHTSLARLLGPPKISPEDLQRSANQLQFFHELVNRLNKDIHGLEAVVSELWYVEEYDVLALALNGRTKVRRFQLGCSRT